MQKTSGISVLGGLGLMALIYPASQYMDLPGFASDYQMGRTKNAITTILSGIVAQEICGESIGDIRMNVGKTLFPDSTVTGGTGGDGISTQTNLTFTNANFNASGNTNEGDLDGRISKSEFDWHLVQSSSTTYSIGRFGVKFDNILNMQVGENGEISGIHERPFAFDWTIDGSYEQNNDGGYDIELDIYTPMSLGMDIEGEVICG